MANAKRKSEIRKYTERLIDAVMEWYTQGDAIDCDETRKNINKDLDSVLPRVEAKFGLKKFKKVLRARSDGKGWFTIRLEDPNLN